MKPEGFAKKERNPSSNVWFKWKGLLERKVTPFSIDVDDGRPIEINTELDNLDGCIYIVTEIHSARIVKGKLRVTGKSHKVKDSGGKGTIKMSKEAPHE